MAKLEKKVNWVTDQDFGEHNPLNCKVEELVIKTDDVVLQFRTEEKELRQISLWGANMNLMIEKYGNETDNWIGKSFRLTQHITPDGKKLRQISF